MAVAAAIIGAAVASAPVLGGTFIFGMKFLGSFLVRAALGLALNALAPKPKTSGANRGYQVNARGSALDHQVIYGEVKVGGAVVFDGTTGTNSLVLHRVIAFAGHEIESFEDIYINDARVENYITYAGQEDFVGTVELPDGTSSTRYSANGSIRIKKYLGTADQTADPFMVSEIPEWTEEHRLRGIAYLYIAMKFDANVFPNGVPEITATIRGKKVYDPRSETTVWSDNPALCLRDYITSDTYGLGEATTAVDDTLVSTAADVCDFLNYPTETGGKRFTCNGAFTTALTPYDLLGDMLTCMGGMLWYSQGKWRMKPAYWTATVLDLSEDDLRSSVSVSTRHSRRDNFNTVKGTFRGAETDWQVTDYPEVTNDFFVATDNGQESVVDIDLPFTSDSGIARRIARIALERNRQQLTVSAAFGLEAFKVQVGDNITLTSARFGWTDKAFEVVTWSFGLTDNLDLQVQMTLREISESVFDDVDDGVVYERDNTTLPSAFDVPSVGLSADARLQVLKEKLTNVVKITTTSAAVDRIDHVEVQFKLNSDTAWNTLGTGELGIFELVDAQSEVYDFRARATNTFGVKGDWEYLTNVDADVPAPTISDATGLSFEVLNGNTFLEWTPVPDLDLSFYRVRHSIETSGATWADATTAIDKVPRPASSVSLASRAGTYMIRPYDKNQISSEGFSSVVVLPEVLEDFTTTLTQTESPDFLGAASLLGYTTPSVTRGGGDTGQLNYLSMADAAFNIEFTTGSDVTTSQIVWETGGSGLGTALGVSGGNLEVYCGNNSTLQLSHAVAASTSYHATLIVDLTGDELRLYVSGSAPPTGSDLVATVAFTQGDWAGTDSTGVGSVSGTTRAPYAGSFLGTIDSLLRLWETNDIAATYSESGGGSGGSSGCNVNASGYLEITDPSTAPSEATYIFSDYIDTGVVRRVKARVDAGVIRINEAGNTFDDLPNLFDNLTGLFDSLSGDQDFADTNLEFYVSTTEDDPAGVPTWTPYVKFRVGNFYGRAFRFKVVLKSSADNVTPNITSLSAVVEYN